MNHIVEAARMGHKPAFEQLVMAHQGLLCATVLSHVGGVAASEEVRTGANARVVSCVADAASCRP